MTEINQHQEVRPSPEITSYWTSVLLVGGIFSLVSFVIGLIFGYIQIGSEPTGSMFTPFMMSGVVICLATCVAGLVAVWHYCREVTPVIKLGRGALIGFLTGVAVVVFSSVLNELWLYIDPEYTQKLLENIVQNVEAMDVPAETRDQLVDQMAAGIQGQNFLNQLLWGIPSTGLLNLLTGMLGVKLFAEKKETY
ncbi:MAG: DUF4199 domain-containing protein [Balneolaceae bacterium]